MPDEQQSLPPEEDGVEEQDAAEATTEGASPLKWWQRNWVGMPEYVHEDMMPWQTIKVHFASREDRDDFERVIGQSLTDTTRAVWHPATEFADNSSWRYAGTPEGVPA